MNEVAKYSLQPISTAVASKHIASLFASGLHSENKGGLSDALVASYLENVEGLPEWAVTEATKLYRKGIRGGGKFVPSPQELANTARELIEADAERERTLQARKAKAARIAEEIAENERYKAIRAGITPESKARVQKMLEKAKAQIAAAKVAVEESEQPPSNLPDMKETHERFKAQARECLIKSMESANA